MSLHFNNWKRVQIFTHNHTRVLLGGIERPVCLFNLINSKMSFFLFVHDWPRYAQFELMVYMCGCWTLCTLSCKYTMCNVHSTQSRRTKRKRFLCGKQTLNGRFCVNIYQIYHRHGWLPYKCKFGINLNKQVAHKHIFIWNGFNISV